MAVVPFLVIDLHTKCSPIALASDASMLGAGVVSTKLTEPFATLLRSARSTRGWYTNLSEVHEPARLEKQKMRTAPIVQTFVESVVWRTNVSFPWLLDTTHDRIEILEFRAVLMAIRTLCLSRDYERTITPILVDSTTVLGAVSTGRSSSRRVNRQCQRLAALLLIMDARIDWHWVASKLNPADQPSRVFTL